MPERDLQQRTLLQKCNRDSIGSLLLIVLYLMASYLSDDLCARIVLWSVNDAISTPDAPS